MDIPYIIVGNGFGAYFIAHQLIKRNIDFLLFSEGNPASAVSAGIINPVILKKFTVIKDSKFLIENLHRILSEMKAYLHKDFFVDEPVFRIFHDENEKQTWLKKRESSDELLELLSPDFEILDKVKNPFGAGKVLNSGRFLVGDFFSAMTNFLTEKNKIRFEKFDYSELNPAENSYKNLQFQHIIFCEGTKVSGNPFFSEIPVIPNKGHALEILPSEEKQIGLTVKKKFFYFPVKDGAHYFGGTYDRNDLSEVVNTESVSDLEKNLADLIGEYELEKIKFGFRATVPDRNPIIGTHRNFKNLHILNGLGTRGVLNGATFSEILIKNIEEDFPIPDNVNVERFYKL